MKFYLQSKGSLFKSILFLIFGALIFAYPNQIIQGASIIFGTLLIVYGIVAIIKNNYETKRDNTTSSNGLIIGIVLLVIGLLFILLNQSISQVIQYVLGAYILFMAIERLIVALTLGNKNSNFITQLIVSILLLLAGLYTVLRANLPVQIIGIIMIIYSVIEIIGYISNKRDISFKEKYDEVKTDLVKIDSKDDNIKDAKIVEDKGKKKKK